MKDSYEPEAMARAVDILFGIKAPTKEEVAREQLGVVLKLLFTSKQTDATQIINEIKNLAAIGDCHSVGSAVMAVLINRISIWDQIFKQLLLVKDMHFPHYVRYYNGVVIGATEAVHFIQEKDGDYDHFPLFLDFFLKFISDPNAAGISCLEPSMSGRFANASGSIINIHGIESFFRKANESLHNQCSIYILGELTRKRIMRLGLEEQLEICSEHKKFEDASYKHKRVEWLRLTNQRLAPGDMWASGDPNNLSSPTQLMPIPVENYGAYPGTDCGNGWHWRPVGLIPIF